MPENTSCDTSAVKSFEDEVGSENSSSWMNNLNYKEIESMLVDKNAFSFVSKNESKLVLMENIPLKVSYYRLLDFLESLKKKPSIQYWNFCFYEG